MLLPSLWSKILSLFLFLDRSEMRHLDFASDISWFHALAYSISTREGCNLDDAPCLCGFQQLPRETYREAAYHQERLEGVIFR